MVCKKTEVDTRVKYANMTDTENVIKNNAWSYPTNKDEIKLKTLNVKIVELCGSAAITFTHQANSQTKNFNKVLSLFLSLEKN